MIILILILIIYISTLYSSEHFNNINYSSFLNNLKHNNNHNINSAFKKVYGTIPQGHLLDTQTINNTIGIPFNPPNSCLYKSISLSQQINPFMYITSPNTRFPSRWIGPYKNSELPHNINISRYNFLYDCCNS